MEPEIETKHTHAVEAAVQAIYRAMFPKGDEGFVTRVFTWANDYFTGNYKDYQPIDARYHDFEHTLQGTLCLARLLQGRQAAGTQPPVDQEMFELAMLAILMHDTGYLKQKGDNDGTGAKYTLVHVQRSTEFAAVLLGENGYGPAEIRAVQNMIRCTGLNADVKSIPFQSDLERTVGYALGTADLLGQMAAKDYVDKLPVLFSEFEESARFNAGRTRTTGLFQSPRDLMEKTPGFWEKYVLPKVKNDFEGVYEFLQWAFPGNQNLYLVRIQENIARLQAQLGKTA